MAKQKQAQYSTRQIRYALENYLTLSEGRFPASDTPTDGYNTKRNTKNEASFVLPKTIKADIDRALQSLKPTEKAVVITLDIAGFLYTEVGYWWNLDSLTIKAIEEFSIRKLKRILNNGVESEK